MAHLENTPTDLPSPPRAVRGGGGCGLWFMRLFILPHMCAGVFLVGQFVLAVLVAGVGTDLAASVTKAHTRPASKGGTIYYLDYRYTAGGREYTNSESVGAATYATVSRPSDLEGATPTVRVRHFELGPVHYHLLTQMHSAWRSAGAFLFIALFWNGILSVFVYVLWVAPLRQRSLIRHGHATSGTIVGTRTCQGKGTTYYATFRFRAPETGLDFEREMRLPGKAEHAMAPAGRPVTVLYAPRNPRRAVAYELSGYRVQRARP